jgi:uroporphyrinogen-III decarboxylase
MMHMNARERLLRTLRGQEVDRVPVYTCIPFEVTAEGFKPGPVHAYDEYDAWREKDPAYWRLVHRMETECDSFFFWRPPCMQSDQLFIPPARMESLPLFERRGRVHTTWRVNANGRVLTMTHAVQPQTGHTWQVEHWCKTAEDAQALLDLSWSGYPPALEDYAKIVYWLGDRGVIWVTIPSPILPVCRLFNPQDFLVLSVTERALIHDLMRLATERIRANLERLLDLGVGPIIRFGGAEHATPPLMSPKDFDALVVDYDAPLVELCKARGRLVAYHCHGHLRHALQRFVEMGVDQVDPVETVPDGDITIKETRRIAGEQITITGNIQMRELHLAEPEVIEARVKELIQQAGPRRLIISTTGTPLEKLTPQVEANYHRLIDATLKYGAMQTAPDR